MTAPGGNQTYGQAGYAGAGATGFVPTEHSGNTAQPMTEEGHPDVERASVGQLIGEVSRDLSTLMRQELELAKAELRQEANEATGIVKSQANEATAAAKAEATKAGKGAGMLGGAAFAGYMLVLFLSLALMWALASAIPVGWSALIVAVVWGLIAAVLAAMGRKKLKEVDPKRVTQAVDFSQLKQVDPKPEQTVDTLKQVPGALKPH
ncbi:phage holin family protein [Modestobacter roseus]|uniref:Putative superfamily III holin-X n=1 Tax=Modestobacter roseus TaxID=1181884 RepID=A0A562IMG9_9ACTN|nr:phage holin family protein [Modestobacter roseus]TWH71893.1 putative superfamily III holin-X [Modestobacter roseus]